MDKEKSKQLESDYLVCKENIEKNSKTFSIAFSVLPMQKRKAVWALYGFNRLLDDIVDENKNVSLLKKEYEHFKNLQQGEIVQTPIYRALHDVDLRFGLDYQAMDDMFKGQFEDLRFIQPENDQEFLEYCYKVAGSVGLMLLPIVATKNQTILQESAKKIGIALQITNVLRDVGEDFAMGRVYFPQSVLQKYGVEMQTVVQNGPNDAYIQLWEAYASLAEEYYMAGLADIYLYDRDSVAPVKAAALVYREIIPMVREQGYRLDQRAIVPKGIKQKMLHQLMNG